MSPGPTVTVLGCSGSYAAPGGACTGLLVRSAGAAVWLDAGPGTLANLQQHVSLEELSAIVVTHEHPDHWLEIPVVYSAVRYYERHRPVPVHSTAGTLARARPLCAELDEAFDWHVVGDGDECTIGDQRWRFARTEHYVETLATRVDAGGGSFVFSSDTGPGFDLSVLGPAPDLAVVESTFLAEHEWRGIQHLSARQAGVAAKAVGARRLVLTHLAPGQEPDAHRHEAETAFGGPVDVAVVGACYDFSAT